LNFRDSSRLCVPKWARKKGHDFQLTPQARVTLFFRRFMGFFFQLLLLYFRPIGMKTQWGIRIMDENKAFRTNRFLETNSGKAQRERSDSDHETSVFEALCQHLPIFGEKSLDR
jgi:hypothetical protein